MIVKTEKPGYLKDLKQNVILGSQDDYKRYLEIKNLKKEKLKAEKEQRLLKEELNTIKDEMRELRALILGNRNG